MKKLYTTLGFTALSLLALAQGTGNDPAPRRKCGTPVYNEAQHAAYEEWIQNVIKKDSQFANSRQTSTVYTIPVVFHIIHSGQAVGTTYNISQAQVNSQITILNQDFRKLNTDFSTYVTQTGLSSLAADCEINFCAAKVSPTGTVLAEPGIDRIQCSTKGWTNPPHTDTYIDATIKPNSIWDPTKYLNIWIVYMNDGTLGYAQFPTVPSASTPTIGDMNGWGSGANTDGVVFDYRYIGNMGTATSPYNKGRTAVHEIGHWLGLWHIWGDDGNSCSGTDYVTDTPNQASENYTCPTTNGAVRTDACTSTSPGVNYQNFMDYSDDKCMVMFTAGQKARIQACMQYCIRRSSLATSTVCSVTDVKEATYSLTTEVYPNPTSGDVYVTVNTLNQQDYTISVLNTLGQTVTEIKKSQSTGGTTKINLQDLPHGVYFVNVKSASANTTKRIVLQ